MTITWREFVQSVIRVAGFIALLAVVSGANGSLKPLDTQKLSEWLGKPQKPSLLLSERCERKTWLDDVLKLDECTALTKTAVNKN